MKKPELLSPVQDFTSLQAAIKGGADSVYFGVKELNMRIGAKNFELKDIAKVVKICHDNDVKAYFTLNSIIYDDEISLMKKILKKLKKEKVDSVICWDYSVIDECEKLKLPIHLSTQASVSNFQTVKFLAKKIKGLKRINLARELNLEQIKDIIKQIKKEKLKIGIETFVHGAMCVSVSGRCFLSQEVFGKSANRGECLQPCRRKYQVKDVEEKHKFELGEEYVMSPKDLCTIEILDKLIEAGINCFKIEGRNRSPEYVKVATEVYRYAIDDYKKLDKIKKVLYAKLKTVYNRGFSTGFYMGKPLNEWSKAYGSKATKKKIYLGKVLNYYNKINVAEVKLESENLKLKDDIMFQGNKTGVVEDKISSIQKNNKKINKAKKGERVGIKVKNKVRENDKVYLIKNS